ncbi:hypothetical protein D3C80_1190460 [compost metagenome]
MTPKLDHRPGRKVKGCWYEISKPVRSPPSVLTGLLNTQSAEAEQPATEPQAAMATLSGIPRALPVKGPVVDWVAMTLSIFLWKTPRARMDSGAKYHSTPMS